MQNRRNKIGEIIRQARIKNAITREELSEKVGISNRYLFSIENEGRIPSYNILCRLVTTLSIDANSFFYTDIKNNSPGIDFIARKLANCNDYEIDVIIATLNVLTKNK